MRMLKPTFALATLGTMLAAASCTLITDVDRTKIPTDTAGTSGSGGNGGSAGSLGGTGGDAGDGSGGLPEGGTDSGTGGTGGTGTGAQAGEGGAGGESGSSGSGGSGGESVVCSKASGRITIIPTEDVPVTHIADGDTFTLDDGVNEPVVFEFDFATQPGVADGNVAIPFDGTEGESGLLVLIADAINAQGTNLNITATAEGSLSGNGEGGAGGEGGGLGGAGAGDGSSGEGGSGGAGGSGSDPGGAVELVNDAYGALGNQRIRDTVGNPNFKKEDMRGGAAVNCDQSPTICSDDGECATSCDVETNYCE